MAGYTLNLSLLFAMIVLDTYFDFIPHDGFLGGLLNLWLITTIVLVGCYLTGPGVCWVMKRLKKA